MMNQAVTEHLYFGDNGNKNKLNCQYFTTIRLWNEKYKVGTRFQIYLRKRFKCKIEIVGVKTLTLSQINDWIARLDSGYSAQTLRDILKRDYKSPLINWETQPLAYIMMKQIDNNDQSQLL